MTGLYYDALNLAQNGSEITSTFFNDGSSSVNFEVYFVAGTPVLLADGTSKPIEKIQSDDMVFAVDHEHPNSTPKPSRVTRVFHNAPQATWKLTLADGQTIQCTKEHPFYVIERGWTSAEDLGIGDHLLRPDGSTVSLSAKEYVEAKQPVFNIEVENAHTYFVGETREIAVLVHNVCPICGGDHPISPPRTDHQPGLQGWWDWVMWNAGQYDFKSSAADCEHYFKTKHPEVLKRVDVKLSSEFFQNSSKEWLYTADGMEISLNVAAKADAAAGVILVAPKVAEIKYIKHGIDLATRSPAIRYIFNPRTGKILAAMDTGMEGVLGINALLEDDYVEAADHLSNVALTGGSAYYCNKWEHNVFTRWYLSRVKQSKTHAMLLKDLEGMGLQSRGRDLFPHFYDVENRMRVRIDPPDHTTEYHHMHIFDENGKPLDALFDIRDGKSPDVHIEIAPPDI